MFKHMFAGLLAAAVVITTASAQSGKPAESATVKSDLLIKTDEGNYSGTMEMTTAKGRVTGTLHVTNPTEITGKIAGTSEAGTMKLEFPFYMVEQKCEGTVRMTLTIAEKRGPSSGTMEAVGCGRDEGRKLTGSVELTPQDEKKK